MQTPTRPSARPLAAGLVLAALAAAGGVLLLLPRVTDADRARLTGARLEEARRTLDAYARVRGHLPCPADPAPNPGAPGYGVGTGPGGGGGCPAACETRGGVAAGLLPTRTLQLEDQTAVDGFGRKMLYLVSAGATAPSEEGEGESPAAAFAVVSAGPDGRFGRAGGEGAAGYGCERAGGVPGRTSFPAGVRAEGDDEARAGSWQPPPAARQ